MGVAVLQGVDDLNEDLAGLLLVKLALVLHVVHELAALGQLHDHYQLLAFDEGVVKLDDILVAQLLDTVRLLIDRVNVFRAMNCKTSTQARIDRHSGVIETKRGGVLRRSGAPELGVFSPVSVALHPQKWKEMKEVLTRLRHIHELDGILHVCLPVSREMNSAEASLSNFFVHLVVVQNRAVIK